MHLTCLVLLAGISAVYSAPSEGTTTPAPKCPPSDLKIEELSNGKKYYFHDDWITYDGAKSLCQRKNMILPSIDNRADLDIVHAKALKIAGNGWWIDASDRGQEPGHFKWGNGKDLSVNDTLWMKVSKQPDSYGQGEQVCVLFSTWYGKSLWDERCGKRFFTLCQVPDGVQC